MKCSFFVRVRLAVYDLSGVFLIKNGWPTRVLSPLAAFILYKSEGREFV